MAKKLLMGNEAFAHAALEAGVNVVAGYPGTPSSELVETVAEFDAAYDEALGVPGISLVEVRVPLEGLPERYAPYWS